MTDIVERKQTGWVFWLFIAIMLVLTGLFVALGVWQVERLGEKEALVAAVAARLNNPPVPFPAANLTAPDAENFDFAPVTLSGHFVPDQTVLVFTSLGDDAKGSVGGTGYWVMTPFALNDGGSAFVNRGFVPEKDGPRFLNDAALSTADQTVTGVARKSERVGGFTPDADKAKRIEWVRNIERLTALIDPTLAPVSQLYVDLPAGPPGALPQGGETVVEFPNNHLDYAGTWFCFAIITPIMLVIWIARQRRGKRKPKA